MEGSSSIITATNNTRAGDSLYRTNVNHSNFATKMADNNDGYSASDPNNGGESKREVCRDFLNKICVRGQHCKYYHPNDPTASSSNYSQSTREDFQFCGDFHKRGCRRSSCRYVHCSMGCMEEYESSGRMNDELAASLVAIGYDEVDGRPLCKEFMNGKCARARKCRFWHIIPTVEREKRATIQSSHELEPPERTHVPPAPVPPPHHHSNYYYGSVAETQSPEPYYPQPYAYSEPKRSRYRGSSSLPPEYVAAENGYGNGPSPPWSGGGGGVPVGLLMDPHMGSASNASRHHHVTTGAPMHTHHMLHSPPGGGAPVAGGGFSSPRERDAVSPGLWSLLNSENVELQRTFELLTKTVNDLRATNETLLAENSLLRTNLQHVSHVTHAAGATNKEAATAVAAAAHMTNVLAAQSAAAASQTTRAATLTPDQLAAYTVAAAAQQAAVVEPSMTLTVPTVVYSSLNAYQR